MDNFKPTKRNYFLTVIKNVAVINPINTTVFMSFAVFRLFNLYVAFMTVRKKEAFRANYYHLLTECCVISYGP